jgi:hypothetical protein
MNLTPEQRQFLRSSEHAMLPFYDMVCRFVNQFNLTPQDAGSLLAQWVRESV